MEVLRDRLTAMKRLMAERQGQSNNGKPNAQPSIEDLWNKPQSGHPGIIDGNFLSVALCGALLVSIL